MSESLRAINATRDSDNSDSWRAAAWLLSHGTARDRYADRVETTETLGLGALFAALTGAASTPPRLGAAGLPMLTERVTDETEEPARDEQDGVE